MNICVGFSLLSFKDYFLAVQHLYFAIMSVLFLLTCELYYTFDIIMEPVSSNSNPKITNKLTSLQNHFVLVFLLLKAIKISQLVGSR